MRLSSMSLVVLAAFSISSCQLIPPTLQSTEKPLWTTDLRGANHGWNTSHTPAFFQAMRQIAFGSGSELVVANDSGPFMKPNAVRGFVIDAKNGSVLREVHWTSDSWPFLFATSTGKYAVVTQGGMAVYSQGLQSILATGSHVADKASPDGRFLSATETIPGHGATILIDADTLKPNGTEIQLGKFPSFVHAPDEMALDFDNFRSAFVGNFRAEMTNEQFQECTQATVGTASSVL